jgi:hypothetical protein
VSEWALDPDTASPISVTASIGGSSASVTADSQRSDVAAAYSPCGAAHGYTVTVPWASGGTVDVCLTAANTGPGATRQVACRSVAIRRDWNRTDVDYNIGGQDIHGRLPGYLHPWAKGADSSVVRCRVLPSGFRPPPSLPLDVPSFYDCRHAGTVDRNAAMSALGVAGFGEFKYGAGPVKTA